MIKIGKNGGRGILALYHIDITRVVFQFTTSAPNASSSTFMVDYLVNSLGFSEKEAIVASSKVRTPFQSAEKPDSVVNFLQTSGFNKTQIKKTVYCAPKILSCNIDKTLKPKIDALKDLGLSGSELAQIIYYGPYTLLASLNGLILPTLELLKSVFGDNNDNNLILLSALKSSPWFLSNNVLKYLPSNVALLQNYGFSSDKIKELLIRKSRYVIQNPKRLQAVLIRVEEKLKIPRDSAMFFHGVGALSVATEEYIDSKFQLYRSFGWTESDILTMARKNPCALTISETKLRRSLNFFIKELGYQPALIAQRGSVVNYSFEKRIIPRNEVIRVLKKKELIRPNYCLLSCLFMGHSGFFKRFVLPFKDKVPGLHDDYMRRVSSPLEAGK